MNAQPTPSPDAAAPSLASRAARGAVWAAASYGGGQVLRLAGNLVLSRLLFEEAFGLMLLVNTFLIGLTLFSDVGVGPSIVQNERGDERRFLDTAWTVQVLRGLVLWGASCLLALPFAAFYEEPRLGWILPVSGATALIAGFNSTKLFSANRHLHMRALFAVEIASQVLALLTMIAWALLDRSVWALVAGGLAHSLARMVLSHRVLPGPSNRLHWEARSARSLFHFGRWIFLSTVLTFFVQQSDRLVFGKLIPITLLGVYGIAAMLAMLPMATLGALSGQVVFPYLSRVRERGEDLRASFEPLRRPLLVLGGWMLSGLIGAGPLIVRILYDERWYEAGWILQWLAVSGWLASIVSTNEMFLLAMGHSRLLAAAGAGKLIGMLVLIPAGHALAGFPGAVAGFAGAEGARYLVSSLAARAEGLRGLGQDLRFSLLCALAAGAGAAAAHLGRSLGDPAAALLAFLAVTGCWLPAARPLLGDLRARLAGQSA